ncbi:GNAT family N-acetyltransferase [Agrobacterium tumefaciens]|uniref:GNAT family N-acetyltransferase n=1 Tax=Agrobacterium tumefaciens TaxID=358 RepID=UPI0021D34502|nr:GNAT family N-acetyltransferase [Agrobacterium tumefaciens]UXS45921.1 GNAT family N-acetyltransferase [Agrobacterium tumefaciens]
MPAYDNATTGETEVMMNSPPIRIPTPRLVLRAARAEDAKILFDEYTGNVQASEFLPRGLHTSQSTTEKLISAWGETTWGKTSRFVWTIIDRRTNRPIGIFLMFIPDDETAEIHYGLGPAFWGHGFAAEAGSAVMQWVREQSTLSEVRTVCAADHNASCRVLEKMGLVRGQLIEQALSMKASGRKIDGWSFIWKRSDSEGPADVVT